MLGKVTEALEVQAALRNRIDQKQEVIDVRSEEISRLEELLRETQTKHA